MKYYLFTLSLLVLVGCGIQKTKYRNTKKSSSQQRRTPVKKSKGHVHKPNWQVKQEKPPIHDDMPFDYGYDLKSNKQASYDVALLMPMRANRVNMDNIEKIPVSTLRFIQFWAGAKLALNDLRAAGIQLNVSAIDTKYSEEDAKRIWRGLRSSPPDVVIGPYKRASVGYFSEQAKKYNFTHISPWISSSTITKNNPFYIQTKAGLRAHYQTILNHIIQNYSPEQVYVVIKEKDRKKEELIREMYAELIGVENTASPHFIEVNVDTVLRGHEMIDSVSLDWEAQKPMVFFLPYSSNKDKLFVYSFLQKYELLSGADETVLYGLYKWLDYGDGIYDILNRMEVRMSISGLVNPFNGAARQFRKRYFEAYGEVPGKDAYEGYDLFTYVGQSLDKYGDKFQLRSADQKPVSRIHTVYDIYPVLSPEENRVEFFENKFVDLIRVKNYNFQRVEKEIH